MDQISFDAVVWSYVGQMTAFSIGILLIAKLNRHTAIWLLANLLGLIGVIQMAATAEQFGKPLSIAATVLNLIALLLRAIAVSDGDLRARRNRAGAVSSVLAIIGMVAVALLHATQFRGLSIMATALSALAANYFFLRVNRKFKGLAGTTQTQAINALIFLLVCVMTSRVYPFGESRLVFSSSQSLANGAMIIVSLGMLWQISYINLLVGRQARVTVLSGKRALRLEERSRQLRANVGMVQKLANERLNLLRLMTHEVRQPLNNAQAVLYNVLEQTDRAPSSANEQGGVAQTVQGVLDDVILTISNTLIAASIIEWKRDPAMVPVGFNGMLELAMLDCPRAERDRLTVTTPEHEVFVQADPALMRLALRNLLANALKYSPPASPVRASILIDDERHGIAFQCTNALARAGVLQGNLFERGERGAASGPDGSGLGLFMVSETARLHHGMLSCWQASPEQVTFELFFPD